MSSNVAPPAEARHGNSVATSCQPPQAPVAMAFLNAAINESGIPRKQIAEQVFPDATHKEIALSKATTGVHAFGLDDFERLPREIQAAWMQTYGPAIGLEVRPLNALDVAQEIIASFSKLEHLIRIFSIARPRMAPGPVAEATPERRRA